MHLEPPPIGTADTNNWPPELEGMVDHPLMPTEETRASRAFTACRCTTVYHTSGVEDELVPSWAEFHHELFQELACPNAGDASDPSLVTLANFETKASLLAEHATVHAVESSSRPFTKKYTCSSIPAAWNRNMLSSEEPEETSSSSSESPWQTVSSCKLPIYYEENAPVGSDEYIRGKAVLMSRRSIRSSTKVHNWAQAVASAEAAGALAVVVFNDLDAMETARAWGRTDGQALCAAKDCDILIVRSVLASHASTPPWPLAGGRMADIAQAWSLLEALSEHDELDELLQRMSRSRKRVWLTRRLVRHHRSQQAEPGDVLSEPPLAFVEGDRWLPPGKQLEALRKQYCEGTGIGSPDICGDFEVRFRGEQGVGSAVVREWMDLRPEVIGMRAEWTRSHSQSMFVAPTGSHVQIGYRAS
eukprot:g15693.t1